MTAAQEGLARQNRPKGREVGQGLGPPLHTVTHPRFSRTTQISKTLLPGAHKELMTLCLQSPVTANTGPHSEAAFLENDSPWPRRRLLYQGHGEYA